MTCTGTSLINRAAVQLLDVANIRWPRQQLLGWLNDAQRQIALMQPSASNTLVALKLVAGAKQSIPTDGWLLLKITRNLGTDSVSAGAAIRIVARKLLDSQNLNWFSDTASTTVQNYVYSVQDQTNFYVYPPSTGTNYVELNYAKVPADLTVESAAIQISDLYQGALLDYMLYRACGQDSEQASMQQLATMYYTSFSTAVQGKSESEIENAASLDMSPPNPAVRGAP